MVERKTLNLVVVGSIPTGGALLDLPSMDRNRRLPSARLAIPSQQAALAQLGERQTEDLKVPGSIPGGGKLLLENSKFFAVETMPFQQLAEYVLVRWPSGLRRWF